MKQVPFQTEFSPMAPTMIWDGKCGFCTYWIIRWKKLTGDSIDYIPYKEIHRQIEEIPEQAFKEKVRLIETDGKLFSGAHAVYKTLQYSRHWPFLVSWYENSYPFRKASDITYSFIANHRPEFYHITKALLGSNAHRIKPYFVIYILALVLILGGLLIYFP